jgi:hypothetical protein
VVSDTHAARGFQVIESETSLAGSPTARIGSRENLERGQRCEESATHAEPPLCFGGCQGVILSLVEEAQMADALAGEDVGVAREIAASRAFVAGERYGEVVD